MLEIIHDCDPGIDDAIAILLIMKTGGVNVKAIITVAGNVPVYKAAMNVFKILSLLGEENRIKVGVGSDKPLLRPLQTAEYYHGPDGLGDTEHLFQNLKIEELMEATYPGIELMIKTIIDSTRPVTIITTGPLTNLAKAISTEPRIIPKVERVVSMGGAIAVPGNITPYAEFNIYTDPEAAHQVLHSGLPITLVPLDVTMKTYLTRKELLDIKKRETALTEFVCRSIGYGIGLCQKTSKGKFYLHDPLAAGVAVDETLIKGSELGHLDVERSDEKTLGRTYFHKSTGPCLSPTIKVIRDIDSGRFVEELIKSLKG
ncbi:MAG: nucleoside hydrolase [Candidatus Bathyarchaeia archaeon]|nr:nucleoside hydrolase [Candidatus Bathyarchaeota archaeon]